MPMYDYKCTECGKIIVAFRRIAERGQVPECPQHGSRMVLQISAPAVHGEIPVYESPKTGKMITSRRERQEDLARSNCVEWDSGMKEEFSRRSRERELKFEKELDHTIDATIAALPARKREKLEGEMAGGLDVTFERSTL